MTIKKVSVIGLGYIGLPTAAMFASRKLEVVGVDINEKAVDTINRGDIHIVEPDLDIVVHAAVNEGYLKATTVAEQADAFLIAVPTPFKESNSETPQPDLSFIHSATKEIAKVLKKGDLVILESTSPVGATESVAKWLHEERGDLTFPQDVGSDADVNIAYCPERVLPGQVIKELVENDRVIGGMSERCSERAIELYKTFVKGECVVTNARTAEMAKLTENACRDVQIAFANELSIICDNLDINVWELIALANRHPRINILQPGPGVGGHCIAVDPWFIISKTPELAKVIRTARNVNDSKPSWVINKVKIAISELLLSNTEKTVKDLTISVYGLAFKPDIDDLRESPALKIAEQLADLGVKEVLAVEPNIQQKKETFKSLSLVALAEAKSTADIHVMLVDHKEFKATPMPNGIIIDTKGVWQ